MALSRFVGVLAMSALLAACGATAEDPNLDTTSALEPTPSDGAPSGAAARGAPTPTAGRPDAAPGKPRGRGLFRRSDQDGDGKLTETELGAKWARLAVADANQDKVLTQDELAQARAAGKLGRGRHPGRQRRSPERLLDRWDHDHDGQLTAVELPPRAWQRFSAADTNADGSIDAGELRTYLEQAAPRGRFGRRN